MAKLNYNELSSYQKYWRKKLSPDKAYYYITLSKTLMHRTIDNDNIISGVSLYYPKDCPDFSIFKDFVEIIDRHSFIEKDVNGFHVTFR